MPDTRYVFADEPPVLDSAPGLVRVTRRQYQAPTGGFDFFHFTDVEGCGNLSLRANNHVRAIVNTAHVSTWGEVEVAGKVAMSSLGCEGSGLDCASSYRLYIHTHTQGMSSFVPSPLTSSRNPAWSSGVAPPVVESSQLLPPPLATPLVCDSQVTVDGNADLPLPLKTHPTHKLWPTAVCCPPPVLFAGLVPW